MSGALHLPSAAMAQGATIPRFLNSLDKKLLRILRISGNFRTFVVPKNIHLYATKFYYIIRPCGARTEVFSLHPAAVSVVETEVTSGRRSCLGAPRTAEAPHVPTCRSQHYLPTIRAAVTALFSWFWALWRRVRESRSFITGKSEFHGRKVVVC